MPKNAALHGSSLNEIAKDFCEAIFNQHNLIALAKRTALEEHRDATVTLILSIERYNDNMFDLYQKMNDMTGSHVSA